MDFLFSIVPSNWLLQDLLTVVYFEQLFRINILFYCI